MMMEIVKEERVTLVRPNALRRRCHCDEEKSYKNRFENHSDTHFDGLLKSGKLYLFIVSEYEGNLHEPYTKIHLLANGINYRRF